MAGDTLTLLRSLMASHSPPLDALVVPSEDYHQSEYVSKRDKRRQFVSGFTGSAGKFPIGQIMMPTQREIVNLLSYRNMYSLMIGLALITMSEARLWTDGRYFLQASKQLSEDWKLMRIGEDSAVEIWMADNLPETAAVGVDPWCISVETAHRWEHAFAGKRQKIVQTSINLVDEVWKGRPAAQINPIFVQKVEFAGRSISEKLKDLRRKLALDRARATIITALDEVAWLYNIRGGDVPYCPVVHAFGIVTPTIAFLYVDKTKLSDEVLAYLKDSGIEVREYQAVASDVILLASNKLVSSDNVSQETPSSNKLDEFRLESNDTDTVQGCNLIWADPGKCCYALYSKLSPDQVLLKRSPLALAKSLKNPVEIEGFKQCHIRDGAAVVQFFAWMDKQMQELYGASGYFKEAETKAGKRDMGFNKLTEVSVSDKLEEFRASKEHFRGLSFPTISSVGPNAAVIHYSPDPKTCSEMDPDSIYLVDSGGQYVDGTTDVTRTVHFGTPSAHIKACYTGVLKGHIALGSARFPNGTNGHALDILARVPLWKNGLDYLHGTGHGVGSFLNVHEGPQQISFRPHARNVALQASMTVTDEPGYYEDGQFGIRLENVLIVKEADTKFNFGEKGYLEFEHITWVPYQRKLMELRLLSPEEIDWINTYHGKCRNILAPHLTDTERAWLNLATEAIPI